MLTFWFWTGFVVGVTALYAYDMHYRNLQLAAERASAASLNGYEAEGALTFPNSGGSP